MSDRLPDASQEYAIDIRALSKRFRRHTLTRSGYTTFKSAALGFFSGSSRRQTRYTDVLKDLTLRIPRGSSAGIIGRNGSGKSTLLKLITGIYRPDSGSISVNGRIAALIELGAGFHPDFSGRENVFLGGIMHGLSRAEIEKRFDSIVEFAELGDVIDDPVRTYSSGMFMRLGFSLAVHTDPDILLVDEVLAVGDAAFVARCKEKVSEIRGAGRTLLLVSHDLEAVERWCDEVLWLEGGVVKDRGEPRRVIDAYRQFVEQGEERQLQEAAVVVVEPAPAALPAEPAPEATRWGSREVEITGVRLLAADGRECLLTHGDDALTVEISWERHEATEDLVFGVAISRGDGLLVMGTNTDIDKVTPVSTGSAGKVLFKMPAPGLLEGAYTLDVAAHRQDGYPYDYMKSALEFKVRSTFRRAGVYSPQHEWSFLPQERH